MVLDRLRRGLLALLAVASLTAGTGILVATAGGAGAPGGDVVVSAGSARPGAPSDAEPLPVPPVPPAASGLVLARPPAQPAVLPPPGISVVPALAGPPSPPPRSRVLACGVAPRLLAPSPTKGAPHGEARAEEGRS